MSLDLRRVQFLFFPQSLIRFTMLPKVFSFIDVLTERYLRFQFRSLNELSQRICFQLNLLCLRLFLLQAGTRPEMSTK